MMKLKAIGLALALAAAPFAASAATVSFSAIGPGVANPLATTVGGTVDQNVFGDIPLTRVGPYNDAVTPYTAVLGGGFASYAFESLRTQLSFVWGTPDEFNLVEFFRGGSLIDTIPGFGGGINIALPTLLAVNIGDNLGFDTVKFSSKGNSFEYGSLAAVPVPAAGFLLVGALGGLAALRRRRKAAAPGVVA